MRLRSGVLEKSVKRGAVKQAPLEHDRVYCTGGFDRFQRIGIQDQEISGLALRDGTIAG